MRWLLRVMVGILQQRLTTEPWTKQPLVQSKPALLFITITLGAARTNRVNRTVAILHRLVQLSTRVVWLLHAHMSGVPVLRALPMSRA